LLAILQTVIKLYKQPTMSNAAKGQAEEDLLYPQRRP